MTTADVFWGVLLALAVFDLTKDLVEYVLYKIQSKKRKKKLNELLAAFDVPSSVSSGAIDYDCDDDCDICNDEPAVTIKRTTKKPVKKAVAKKKTVKKAVAKKRK